MNVLIIKPDAFLPECEDCARRARCSSTISELGEDHDGEPTRYVVGCTCRGLVGVYTTYKAAREARDTHWMPNPRSRWAHAKRHADQDIATGRAQFVSPQSSQ